MSQVFALVGTLEDSGIFKGVKTKSTTAKKERGKDVASFEIVFMLESAEDGDEEELEEEGDEDLSGIDPELAKKDKSEYQSSTHKDFKELEEEDDDLSGIDPEKAKKDKDKKTRKTESGNNLQRVGWTKLIKVKKS